MSRRGAAAVIAVLLAAGCTATTPQAQPTAEPVSASTSPSPTGQRTDVSTAAVAGVPLGTPGDEAERRLTEALGPPLAQELRGCNGESGRSLTWGALTAFLSDGAEGDAVVLRGWLVTADSSSERLALPYETAVGQTTDQVMSQRPAAEGETVTEGPYAGSFLVTTPDAPELLWRADAQGDAVDQVAYEAEVCD